MPQLLSLHAQPSAPGFTPCPTCGCLTLRDRTTGERLTPTLGEPHDCAVALLHWGHVQRYLAGELFGMFIRLDGKTHFSWFTPALHQEALCPPTP
jgi:hypothetical protein